MESRSPALTSRDAYDRAMDDCFAEDKATFEAALTDLVRLRDSYPPEWGKLIAYLDEAIPHARGALLQKDSASYAQALSSVTFGRLPVIKDMEEQDKEALKKTRDKVKEEAQKQAEAYGQDQEKQWGIHLAGARVLSALIGLWRRQEAIYDQKKRDRDRIDFNDLEHF